MSLRTGLAPNTVLTALDEVFFQEVDRGREPQEIMVDEPVFFQQMSTNKQAEITEENQGPGAYEETNEEQEVPEATIRNANKKTHTIITYEKGVHIPKRYFDDEMHSMVDETIKNFGRRSRTSRDKFGYQNSYADAFSGVTTSAGTAWASDSHTLPNGSTLDNLETGILTPANFETIVTSLRLQIDNDGELGAHIAKGLLVPPNLHPDAVEITKSEKQANTANNNLNYFSNLYPGMLVGASAFIHSSFNSLNSNANTSYFVVSENHSCRRYIRASLETALVDWKVDKRNRYHYKAMFREVVSVVSPQGFVASSGTV